MNVLSDLLARLLLLKNLTFRYYLTLIYDAKNQHATRMYA